MAAFSGEYEMTLMPTDLLKSISRPSGKNKNWAIIQGTTFKITSIKESKSCELKAATPGDEFILVVGTADWHTTSEGNKFATAVGMLKKLKEAEQDPSVKFGAIIQLNSFNDSYTFVTVDTGDIDKSEWSSENVSSIIK